MNNLNILSFWLREQVYKFFFWYMIEVYIGICFGIFIKLYSEYLIINDVVYFY